MHGTFSKSKIKIRKINNQIAIKNSPPRIPWCACSHARPFPRVEETTNLQEIQFFFCYDTQFPFLLQSPLNQSSSTMARHLTISTSPTIVILLLPTIFNFLCISVFYFFFPCFRIRLTNMLTNRLR